MKKFDNQSCPKGHTLKEHLQKVWLILCILAVPFTLQAEAGKNIKAEPTGNVSKNYQHWADVDAEWNGDILSAQKSDYFEGEVIPHVYVVEASQSTPLVNGQTYTMDVNMNYFQSNTNSGGFAHMTTYNISRSPGLLPNASGLTPTADATFTGAGMEGVFYTVDADIVSVSRSIPAGSSTKDQTVTITWIYTGTTTTTGIAEIYFGLYIAEPGQVPDQGMGETDGASAWTGGSLQTTVNDAVFGGGALSIQLAPSAIIRGTISGLKYSDLNNNGNQDAGEPTLAGWKIYLDLNNNGTWEEGEPWELTAADGTYSFSVIPDADRSDIDNDPYIVREVQQATYTQTEPVNPNYYSIVVTAAAPVHTGKDFGNFVCINPEINTPAIGAVCQGATSASVSYASVSGTPDQYSIDWNAAANMAGLVDVAYTALPASPFTIAIPGNLAGTTYTGTIYVRNSGTNCVSSGTQITLTINPTPAVFGLSATGYCAGSAALGTITLADSESGVNYQLYTSAGVAVQTAKSGTTEALVWTGVTVGTGYYIVATGTGNCTSTTGTINITANPLPNVNAGADKQLTCTTKSVILDGSSTTAGVTYSWTGPGDFMSAEATPTVSNAGIYTLTVTNTATGCTATDEVEVTVNDDLPEVSIGTNGQTTTLLTCNVPTITLTAAARVNGELNPAYVTLSWTGPNGFTSSAQRIEVSVAGTYVLTATNTQNGCSATASIVVYAPVYPNASAGPDKVLTCTQSTVMLEGSSTHFEGWASYTWVASNGGNIVSGGHTLTPIVDKAGTYTLTVRDSRGGCETSDEVVVTEDKEIPHISVTTDEKPILTCTNSDISFRSYSSTEGATFLWTGPNEFTTTEQSFTATVAGDYTLTVTNPRNGCTTSATITITDGDNLPVVNAGPDKVLTCTTTSVTLEGSTDSSPAGYLWSSADGTTISVGRTAIVDKPGVYTLRVTNIYTGCVSTDEVVVTEDKALPNISAQGGTLSCETGTLQLMGASTTAGATYTWTGPEGYSSTAQNPTVNMAGEYTLTVMNPENGCRASATVTVHPQPVVPQPEVVCYTMNFEENETGFISSASTGAGVVNIFNYKRNVDGTYAQENHASIFDTGNPTGDDLDLWTPDWGHVLIINQDMNPEPNDNAWGGEMTLDFSEIGPVTMTSLKALDFDLYENNSWIYLYDGKGNELYKVQIQSLGNMSQQVVDLGNTKGVMYMRVILDGFNEHHMLAGSGAIDDIKFCVETEAEAPCETVEPTNEIQASAFPMPFSDRTTIEFTATESQDYIIQLFDAKGRMIRELTSGKARAGERVTVEVDASDLPNGMYIANIIGKTGIKKSVKLINKK
ncbi:T9SS type A sorting domain-containing protein [Pontibacter populi]|uniref:T9SS type A sorting domain-containing protein n=1 Tax=Pontibacter populi TaxID=890055 RepID=A0ABV1RPD1_9BACT